MRSVRARARGAGAVQDVARAVRRQHVAIVRVARVRRRVELLGHPSPSVQTPALRTVGNIVTGDDLQTQIVINCGALPCLLRLLTSHKKSIRKEACWTISNITAGNKDQIQNVIDCGPSPTRPSPFPAPPAANIVSAQALSRR